MYKLITFHLNQKFEFETETLEEALSLAIDAFNNNHELIEIQKDWELKLFACDIYHAINKRIY
jgi:hypothetical protein